MRSLVERKKRNSQREFYISKIYVQKEIENKWNASLSDIFFILFENKRRYLMKEFRLFLICAVNSSTAVMEFVTQTVCVFCQLQKKLLIIFHAKFQTNCKTVKIIRLSIQNNKTKVKYINFSNWSKRLLQNIELFICRKTI